VPLAHTCNHRYSGNGSGGSRFKASPGKYFVRPYLKKKKITKIGLVEWLKVKALSSNPSNEKKKKDHK
jgi:hypothetical protein